MSEYIRGVPKTSYHFGALCDLRMENRVYSKDPHTQGREQQFYSGGSLWGFGEQQPPHYSIHGVHTVWVKGSKSQNFLNMEGTTGGLGVNIDSLTFPFLLPSVLALL